MTATAQTRPGPTPNDLPLSGIRILDLTRALAGPLCTALLGDLGADVVKVEGLEGEVCRTWGPWQGSESLYFLAVNRNKRSIAVDMWSDRGRELLQTMAKDFDVVVENFRPGVIDALGLGKDWASEHAPNLVVTSISGFGHIGPRANEACFDQIALGMGGLMSVNGSPDSGPMRSGIPLADTFAGMFAALGIAASLVGRRPGRTVSTSLLESVLSVLTFQGQRYLSSGDIPELVGNDHPVTVPYGVFRTADKPINLAAATSGQWAALCSVIGMPELANDERFASGKDRLRNKRELVAIIEARFTQEPAAHWLTALGEAHVPAGPINNIGQAFDEPQVVELGAVQTVTHATIGSVTSVRGPLWIDGEPTPIRVAAPALGQHTSEILLECGFSDETITDLRNKGVVRGAEDIVRA